MDRWRLGYLPKRSGPWSGICRSDARAWLGPTGCPASNSSRFVHHYRQGCGAAWSHACFGSKSTGVRIPPSLPAEAEVGGPWRLRYQRVPDSRQVLLDLKRDVGQTHRSMEQPQHLVHHFWPCGVTPGSRAGLRNRCPRDVLVRIQSRPLSSRSSSSSGNTAEGPQGVGGDAPVL
jgi:hypothetical protein